MNRLWRWIFGALILLPASVYGQGAPATRPAVAKASTVARLPAGVRAIRNVRYGEAPGKANLLDVYLPESPDATPRPLIVWIHGGGWIGGDKAGCPAVNLVATAGYVAASINYRFSSEAIFPAQIEDCKGAIRFLRAHAKEYDIDPERVGVWGASAGGHLVALLGTTGGMKEVEGTVGGNLDQSSRVQCVVDWFGPTDFINFADQTQANPNRPKGDPVFTLINQFFGGTVQEKHDLAVLASPILHISKDDPPFLIQQGEKDPLVPAPQSQTFYDALKAAGVDATLDIVAGAGHGNGFGKVQLIEAVGFLEKHLKPTLPAQALK